MNLTNQKCIPCEVGGVPLTKEEATFYMKDVPQWTIDSESKKITRKYKFKDFLQAVDFINKVAELAEREGHHQDISVSYNKVTLELTTHAVKGLSVNDFIVAAKIDKL